MRWNKYTLITTTEAEDLISSMMMDVGIEGIEIEDKVPLSEQDKSQMFVDILPEGPEDDGVARISFYLEPETDNAAVLAAVQKGLDEIRGWGIDVGAGTIEASQTEDKDWINNWKQYFKPFVVEDILIKPTWEEIPQKDQDKLLIQIDPGTAFGTGMHETTQLCIQQLKKYIHSGMELLDVGTGSGILSIVGLKLGAKHAVGTDLDPNAISAAKENMLANEISEKQFEVRIGNIIEDSALQQEIGFEKYDIAVANILADIILLLQTEIAKHIKVGGYFITSGILESKRQIVETALTENVNFELVETITQGEWVSITARRK